MLPAAIMRAFLLNRCNWYEIPTPWMDVEFLPHESKLPPHECGLSDAVQMGDFARTDAGSLASRIWNSLAHEYRLLRHRYGLPYRTNADFLSYACHLPWRAD